MKLLCLNTGKEVVRFYKLTAVSGDFAGYDCLIEKVKPPLPEHHQGKVIISIAGFSKEVTLPPHMLDCVFINDDSLVTSVTYDNEKSLRDVMTDAICHLVADRRLVRKIFVGYREWDQLRDQQGFHNVPSKGLAKPARFLGVLVDRLRHREHCLAFEHGPDPKHAGMGIGHSGV